ncbi:hypothetical protein RB195_017773 [Necator americanus]|uniref:Reverse transcriptase domain-containing protein n=1 Tax=Necator americanus TaxID=51031 RepID=A0ABR1C6P4_NECAM
MSLLCQYSIFWEDAVANSVHDEYDRLEEHLHEESLRLKRSWRSWTTKTSTTTPHIRKFRELYRFLFTIKPYPLYNDVTTSKEGATFENAKRVLKWNNMGVEVDGWHFAYDILLMTSTIYQAEPMLVEFDTTCEKIGLLLNLEKAIYMRNGWVSDAPFPLYEKRISECSSYVYLGWEN